ncbi:MAG: paraquat-inducible protein A [Pseudomonadota bacterium]
MFESTPKASEFTERISQSDLLQNAIALNARWVACKTCDELFERPVLKPGEIARCTNCHSVIATHKPRQAERTLALMIASLLVYVVAVIYPFMRMERSGISNQISVVDSVGVLWQSNMQLLALFSGTLILLFPLLRVALLCGLASAMFYGRPAGRKFAWIARLAQVLEPWSMADIFMLGVIVSLVKIGTLVEVELGAAFWGMTSLVIFLTLGTVTACRDSTWQYLREQV